MTNADPAGRHDLANLLYLMSRLRDPDTGCPWDVKQSFRSIVPSTIEEAYEVAAAIESDDFPHLQEELGDLLFQVIFYSQLAKEQNLFDFHGVVDGLTAKLIRRHPHVFPDGTLESQTNTQSAQTQEVKVAWEALKQLERQRRGAGGLLEDVPLGLPALTRAAKLQKRAAHVGFDWREAAEVIAKVEEELSELKEAVITGAEDQQLEELGDLLFSLVNLARHLRMDAETALRNANAKFTDRFTYIEEQFRQSNQQLGPDRVDLMEVYWQQAKTRAKS